MKIWKLERNDTWNQTSQLIRTMQGFKNVTVFTTVWRVASNGTFIYGPYEFSRRAAIWRWCVEQCFDWMPRSLRMKILIAKQTRYLARKKK